MALELPGWVVNVFWLIGLPWPGIDEDELRAWAASVRGFASGIEASSARTGRLTASLAGSSRSSFTDTMAGHWEQHHKAVTSLRGPMDAFADALDAAADAVVVQKGIVIGAAIALAGEVIATQGEALFTFGLAEAEVPAEVALTRTVVKIALQDLEAELIGKLINVAAADITAHLNATIRNLLGGAVSVTFEAASLKIDLNTLRSAAATVRSQAADTEEAGTAAYSENATRDIEDPGAGGRWAIVQVVEQALLSVAADLFRSLPHTLSAIQDDTAGSLDDAATTIENTDKDLSGQVPHPDTAEPDGQPDSGPAETAPQQPVSFADKAAARQAFGGEMRVAANRFFRDATAKSTDFQAQDLGDGKYRLQFFSPARNPGYGKLYIQEIGPSGAVLREFKDTLGPDGLIERKWIHGGP